MESWREHFLKSQPLLDLTPQEHTIVCFVCMVVLRCTEPVVIQQRDQQLYVTSEKRRVNFYHQKYTSLTPQWNGRESNSRHRRTHNAAQWN